MGKLKRRLNIEPELYTMLDKLKSDPNSLINQGGRKYTNTRFDKFVFKPDNSTVDYETPISKKFNQNLQRSNSMLKTTFKQDATIDKYYEGTEGNYQDDAPYDLFNMVNVTKKMQQKGLNPSHTCVDLGKPRKVITQSGEGFQSLIPPTPVKRSLMSEQKNASLPNIKEYKPLK